MRLYPRAGQVSVHDPEYGIWGPSEKEEVRQPTSDGGFDFPDELSDRLVRLHHRGRPMWETEQQRNVRTRGEEQARRRDPETLYSAVEDIAGITRQLAGLQLGKSDNPDVDALRAQVAELQAQLEAKNAETGGAPEDDGSGTGNAKDSGSGKDGSSKSTSSRSPKSNSSKSDS